MALPCPERAAAGPCSTSYARHPPPGPRSARRGSQPQRRCTCIATAAKGLGDGELVAGIDLGTTNSCIAVTRGEAVEVALDAEGRSTIPSVVAFLDDGECLVGQAARRYARRSPGNAFFSVKRLIGRRLEDVRSEAERVPYGVSGDEDGQATLICPAADGGALYPEEVSARVLVQLLATAEEHAGGTITKAVISVPAYFTDAQREATVAAGRMAGLEKVKLLKEPVAAALAYGVSVTEDQTVMVLDLGGGTFDVSILEVGGGVCEVLSTGGDAFLGGDDWDSAIVSWLGSKHLGPNGVSWRKPEVLANLKALAEQAKIKLGASPQVALRMPVGGPGGQPLNVALSQSEFDRLAEPLYTRLRLPVDACCWQAGVDLEAAIREHQANKKKPASKQRAGGVLIRPKQRPPVSRVLLVGGGTRMPAFQRFVRHMTGLAPDENLVDPDLAVAIGAAVHAGSLSSEGGSLSRLETMEPLRRALLEALARKELLENEGMARERLGEQYEAFVRQQQREAAMWEKEAAPGGRAEGED